jgi:hypothetical protein
MATPPTVQQALDRAKMARNRRGILALNDRHVGATMFVIGSSPQLNDLSAPQIELLSRAPSIGLNRTQYCVRPMYFLASYTQEAGLALRVGGPSVVLQAQAAGPATVPGTLAVWKRPYEEDRGLPRRFNGHRPILYNWRNIGLAATHLALIMGARRVVYIGLSQRSQLRYFDTDHALRERMIADIAWTFEKGYVEPTTPDLASSAAYLREPPEVIASRPYYARRDHTPSFRIFFAELERHGVEPIATLQDSVVYDAGARYVPLDEAIERFAVPVRRGPARPPLIARRRRRTHIDIGASAARRVQRAARGAE